MPNFSAAPVARRTQITNFGSTSPLLGPGFPFRVPRDAGPGIWTSRDPDLTVPRRAAAAGLLLLGVLRLPGCSSSVFCFAAPLRCSSSVCCCVDLRKKSWLIYDPPARNEICPRAWCDSLLQMRRRRPFTRFRPAGPLLSLCICAYEVLGGSLRVMESWDKELHTTRDQRDQTKTKQPPQKV